ncbi:MAG: hypothetical protein ACD_29C00084G0002 [uncultured bacterium]|nr:MAG: hypothetical protein ACD_29C00084G0002 [uncultured bacterium]OGT40552.1 MAG: hypothetical protein A3F12_07440 [Gammaproteobacteria bacterium RIFCSPHIGHO2_12_FULL_38_14]
MGLFSFNNKENSVTEVGWLVDTSYAGFIWYEPRPIMRQLNPPKSSKAAQRCPAMMDFESRYFEVLCPIDLHLGFTRDDKNRPVLVNKAGSMSSIAASKLVELMSITSEDRWRYPDKPIIQIAAPYRFISDEVVYMSQLPAFLHYYQPELPGTTFSGRFPIHVWPRKLQWAFEWHDTSKDLILKRGEPWFVLLFETTDPTKHINMVPAEMTEQLKEFCSGLDNVTGFVNGTFSLFKTAMKRRPKVLLKKKSGC